MKRSSAKLSTFSEVIPKVDTFQHWLLYFHQFHFFKCNITGYMHIFSLCNNFLFFVTTLLVVSQPVNVCIIDNTPFCK